MLNLERNSHHPEIELKQATERYSDHTISVLCKESISQSVSSVAQSCPTLCDPMKINKSERPPGCAVLSFRFFFF